MDCNSSNVGVWIIQGWPLAGWSDEEANDDDDDTTLEGVRVVLEGGNVVSDFFAWLYLDGA